MHARYLSPVVLARLGANLDVLSGGRWGWNIVPGSKGSEAKLFGITDQIEHDERYAVVAETLAAVRALWGAKGMMPKWYDVVAVWRDWAENVQGLEIDCGHYLPEEAPEETYAALKAFFMSGSGKIA